MPSYEPNTELREQLAKCLWATFEQRLEQAVRQAHETLDIFQEKLLQDRLNAFSVAECGYRATGALHADLIVRRNMGHVLTSSDKLGHGELCQLIALLSRAHVELSIRASTPVHSIKADPLDGYVVNSLGWHLQFLLEQTHFLELASR
jgi:hypothetical protein